jgi:hypothetical protein
MRFYGGLLILLIHVTVGLAQPTGVVESIGFGGHFRPDCWIPMVVRIAPDSSQTATYQIRIEQEDLDRDRVVYTRTITLTGNVEGQPLNEQRFWMYFIPQPAQGGLPSSRHDGTTVRELQNRLKVSLHTDRGRFVAPITISDTINNLDPARMTYDARRGTRFVLAVGEPGRSNPDFREYETAVGLMENVEMVLVQPRHLPEHAIGYEMVDAVLWLDADPPDPARQADDLRRRALREYVRSGGRLVICQPMDRDQVAGFRDLLPVTVIEMRDLVTPEPLRTLARGQDDGSWRGLTGPFRVGIGEPKPGAIVARWIDWNAQRESADGDGTRLPPTPYIVRMRYGMGCVTWVAQDLGDSSLSRARSGWAYIWDQVFDWNNSTVIDRHQVGNVLSLYESGPGTGSLDLGGTWLVSATDHGARSMGLVFLAMIFFVGYWAIAGPGMYLFLAGRKREHMNWFLYAAAALVATAVTVVVVQLVLRGPPQVRHVSIVQVLPDGPAVVHSRIGLYIPRDGMQRVELREAAVDYTSYITPLAVHPQHLSSDIDFPAWLEYEVSLDEISSGMPEAVDVPYRSTLKKLQARWTGEVETTIGGEVLLVMRRAGPSMGYLGGTLYNGTGRNLQDVYIAFAVPGYEDRVLYLPEWQEGAPLVLEDQFIGERSARILALAESRAMGPGTSAQGPTTRVHGHIGVQSRGRDGDWDKQWYHWIRTSGIGDLVRASQGDRFSSYFVMMSLFERLPTPIRVQEGRQSGRFELLRRGARHLDMSPALSAGSLVVLARADGPLPFPLEVEGQRIGGEGIVYYQFVVPIDREVANDEAQSANDESMTNERMSEDDMEAIESLSD